MSIKELLIEVKSEEIVSCINCGYLRLIGETNPRSSGLPINEAGDDISRSIAYEYQWSLSLTGTNPDNSESSEDWVNKLRKTDYPILVQILFHNRDSRYAVRAISGTIKPSFMIKGSFYEFLKDGWANLFGETVKSFGEYSKNEFVPHNLERNCIVYTGTHDFNTAKGWFESEALHKEKMRLFKYIGREADAEEISWEFIRLAMASVANTAILPMQDVLSLGKERE